jgi:Hint domain
MLKSILIGVAISAVIAFVVVNLLLARCLVEGTEVDTPDGPRRVEALRVGDALLTLDAGGRLTPTSVVAIRRGTALAWVRLSLGDGLTLDVTPTHPLAAGAEWRSAGRLRAGDNVRTVHGPSAVTATASRFGVATVYDLSVEPGETFLAEGILVHNKRGPSTESDALGSMRTLMAAQAAYAQMSGGHYARVECLVSPGTCGFPPRRAFVDPSFLEAERGGYSFDLRLGPDGKSYAYVAIPVKGLFGRAHPSAIRGFCGDDTERLCFTVDGTPPPVAGHRCAPNCQDLR